VLSFVAIYYGHTYQSDEQHLRMVQTDGTDASDSGALGRVLYKLELLLAHFVASTVDTPFTKLEETVGFEPSDEVDPDDLGDTFLGLIGSSFPNQFLQPVWNN
jgi:hypothetical protein